MKKKTTALIWLLVCCLLAATFGQIVVGFAWIPSFWALVLFFILLFGFSSKCPQCGEWWASVHKGSESLHTWQAKEDVTRYDITRDRNGREISRTERTEQVTVNYDKREHRYKCKRCHAEWTVTKVH